MSIKQGIVPRLLKEARVIPVYKSGEKEDVNYCRPISILPVISKILERFVRNGLCLYMVSYHLD